MGIFDVFKTKVHEAAEKAGDVAGQTKDKISDLMDKKKGGPANEPSAQAPAAAAATSTERGAEAASDMVSEGAPVAQAGEAAPGVGDDGAPAAEASGGMTQSIKDNVAKGADKTGEMAKGATGNRHDDKIDSAVQQAKDRLD